MKERPILFSGAMVRAILSGRKTQTRRVCKIDWHGCLSGDCPHVFQSECDSEIRPLCPFGAPGDRLWVRETHCLVRGYTRACWVYRADNLGLPTGEKWKPSIFMRRETSRITLEIVSVRVERLQEISEGDAVAEGVGGERDEYDMPKWPSATAAFDALWCSINGIESYKANPWVWVVEFKKL